jgi:hypothetical protein
LPTIAYDSSCKTDHAPIQTLSENKKGFE